MKTTTTIAMVAMLAATAATAGDYLHEEKVNQWTVKCVKYSDGSIGCNFATWYTAKDRETRRMFRGRSLSNRFVVNDQDLAVFTYMIGSPEWKIKDRKYKVEMGFSDGVYKWECDGVPGVQTIKCQFSVGEKNVIWQDIANKGSFVVKVEGHTVGQFSLKGSTNALLAAMRALRRLAPIGNDTFDRSPDSGDTF